MHPCPQRRHGEAGGPDRRGHAPPAVVEELLAEVAKSARPVKRAYGDWTAARTRGMEGRSCSTQSIQPIQQFAYTRGKNATDAAMVIDAMDLLYSGALEGFLHRLQRQRLHPAGRPHPRVRPDRVRVRRTQDAKPFVAACDKFIYIDLLASGAGTPRRRQRRRPGAAHRAARPQARSCRRRSAARPRTTAGPTSARSGRTCARANRGVRSPRLRSRRSSSELVRAQAYVEVKDVPGGTGGNQLWVRLKPAAAKPRRKK